ncbi:MAG: M67 family metallopeptidase [Planctomycetaceae bacterium]|jgi:proteasome lid subunit RPN8/RPN11|nr:M67 family metallopeptidase [Planctomycetaceae bacterium]
MILRLKQTDYAKILTHARAGLPNEACGLIAGTIDGEIKTIEKVFPMTNVDQSREHFSINPREQLAAIKEMRTNGWLPLGNFHSHPETPARPSAEDVRLAFDAAASYLILSLAEPEPVLRAFHVENGRTSMESVEIVGDELTQ